jgi:hypothetical protein
VEDLGRVHANAGSRPLEPYPIHDDLQAGQRGCRFGLPIRPALPATFPASGEVTCLSEIALIPLEYLEVLERQARASDH